MRHHLQLALAGATSLVIVGGLWLVLGPADDEPRRASTAGPARPSAQAGRLAPSELSLPEWTALPAQVAPPPELSPQERAIGEATAPVVGGDGRADRARSAPGPRGSRPRPAPSATGVLEVRAALRSPDPRARLDALRAARDLDPRDLGPDVALLLRSEKNHPVRAVATQVLAQGDAVAHRAIFEDLLRTDRDPFVRLSAAFGLARGGDDGAAAWLLRACAIEHQASRKAGPRLALKVLAAALEDPAIRSPAVIDRFVQLARAPGASPATHAHARDVLRRKGVNVRGL